jgi:hypothetical protein
MRSVTTERTQKTIFAVLEAEAQMDTIVNLHLGSKILKTVGSKFAEMG